MPTQATIFKNALRLAGEPSNVGVDSDKKIVRAMVGAWDDVVGDAFEEHSWNAFKSLQQLTQVTPAVPGWAFTFNAPAGCKRIIKVSNYTDEDREGIDYSYQAGKILTNDEQTFCWFVDGAYLTQIGGWPQSFANYIGALLADEAYPINDEGDSTRSRINDAVLDRRSKAKSFDASTDPVVRGQRGTYVRARSNWRPGGLR